jgi:hypothetical protein
MLSQSMPFLAGILFSLSLPPSFCVGAVGADTEGATGAGAAGAIVYSVVYPSGTVYIGLPLEPSTAISIVSPAAFLYLTICFILFVY